MLNPLDAPVMLQGVFHPAYMHLHRDAGRLLGQPALAVFRGEGGEIERRPAKTCEVYSLRDGVASETRWPSRVDPRQEPDAAMDLSRLGAVWRGEIADAYADAAVAGTMAIALHALGAAADVAGAEAMADELWRGRDKRRLFAAA
jgi:anthranilate phosphoribosyltransferase